MDVTISVKHMDVEDSLKEEAKALANRLNGDFQTQKITSIRVLFAEERQWKIVELLLNAKNLTLHAAAKTTDTKASLNSAFDKLGKQLTRYLDRIQKLSVKPDNATKEKIWTSVDLAAQGEDEDLDGYQYELE